MGGILSCCCPEGEGEGGGAGDGGDAYGAGGVTSDVAPLITAGANGAAGHEGDPSDGMGPDPADHFGSYGGSFPVGSHHHHAPFNGGLGQGAAPAANKVQQRLNEILQEAGKQMIDCSESGQQGDMKPPPDPEETSVAYGKRLSAVASALASKHQVGEGGGGTGGLADVGAGHRAERMSRQSGEVLLREGDNVLVTEVGAHSGRTVEDCAVKAHKNLIVPFGKNSRRGQDKEDGGGGENDG